MLQGKNTKMRNHSQDLEGHRIVVGRIFSQDMLRFLVVQSPMFLIQYFTRSLEAAYTTLLVDKAPTEADVVRYILNTPVGMLANECEGKKGTYEIDIQDARINLKSIYFRSVPEHIYSWRMIFSLDENSPDERGMMLHEFTLNGEPITAPGTMLSALLICHTASVHTRIHTVVDVLTEYIRKNNIEALRPTTRFTDALHWNLLNGFHSPIDARAQFIPFFAIWHVAITKESIWAESKHWNGFTHSGIHALRHSKFAGYYKFLWAARTICLDELSQIGVGMPYAELFFISTVVHSTDHYHAVKMSKGLRVWTGLIKEEGFHGLLSSFCMKNFMTQFTQPTTNPLYTNKMSDQKEGTIYRNIYERMAKVDKELADVVTCSMMF